MHLLLQAGQLRDVGREEGEERQAGRHEDRQADGTDRQTVGQADRETGR